MAQYLGRSMVWIGKLVHRFQVPLDFRDDYDGRDGFGVDFLVNFRFLCLICSTCSYESKRMGRAARLKYNAFNKFTFLSSFLTIGFPVLGSCHKFESGYYSTEHFYLTRKEIWTLPKQRAPCETHSIRARKILSRGLC